MDTRNHHKSARRPLIQYFDNTMAPAVLPNPRHAGHENITNMHHIHIRPYWSHIMHRIAFYRIRGRGGFPPRGSKGQSTVKKQRSNLCNFYLGFWSANHIYHKSTTVPIRSIILIFACSNRFYVSLSTPMANPTGRGMLFHDLSSMITVHRLLI